MAIDEELAELRAEVALLQVQNAHLKAELTQASSQTAQTQPDGSAPMGSSGQPDHAGASRRDVAVQIIEHRLEACPECAGRLSASQLAHRQRVVELPRPAVTEHHRYKGWCYYCGTWREAGLGSGGRPRGAGRLGADAAELFAYLGAVFLLLTHLGLDLVAGTEAWLGALRRIGERGALGRLTRRGRGRAAAFASRTPQGAGGMARGLVGGAQAGAAATPSARLWRNRDFSIFWAGQTLSTLGDAFAVIALPLLVLQATGSVAQMGLVTGTFAAGQLAAGVFAGAVVDRVDRRRLMILCDVLRALLYATIPLSWALGRPEIWLIYVVVALGSLLGMTFQVAYITAVANLVDRDQITDANGRLQATLALAFVAGPMLAGLIAARYGPAVAIGVDAASFAISAFSLALLRLRRAAAIQVLTGAPAAPNGRLGDLLAGVRFVLREPVLRSLTLLCAGVALLMAAGLDLFIFHLKHDLRLGDSAVGVVFGLASIGAILGAMLAPALRRRLGFGAVWIGGIALAGVAIAGVGLTSRLALVAPLAMGYTFGDGVAGIVQMSLRQELAPDHLLGRVTSAFWTLITVPGPIGAALLTALAARSGAPAVLVLMGAAVVGVAAVSLFTPVRTSRPELSGALAGTAGGEERWDMEAAFSGAPPAMLPPLRQ